MRTVSCYMDADLADGTIARVLWLVQRNGHTYVETEYSNGERWVYLDATIAMRTGEIAREGHVMYDGAYAYDSRVSA